MGTLCTVSAGTLMWWWIEVSVGRRQYKNMNSICRITGPLSHPLLAEDKVDSTAQEGAVSSPSLYPGSTERKLNSPLQYHQVHQPSALMSDSYGSCLVHVCICMSAALSARGATIMHQTRHTDDFRSLGSYKILHLCIRFAVSKVLLYAA